MDTPKIDILLKCDKLEMELKELRKQLYEKQKRLDQYYQIYGPIHTLEDEIDLINNYVRR